MSKPNNSPERRKASYQRVYERLSRRLQTLRDLQVARDPQSWASREITRLEAEISSIIKEV